MEDHITTSILPAGGSDHCAVTLTCQRQSVQVDRAARRSRWALKKADWDLYRAHLNEILRAHASEDVLQYSVHNMSNLLQDAMTAAATKSIPYGGPRPGAKMWWTEDLTEKKRELEDLHRTLNTEPAEQFEEISAKIVTKRRAFEKRMAEAKKASWTRSCDNLRSTHEAFQVIGAMRGKRRREAACALETTHGMAVTPAERANAHLKQFQAASTPSPEYKQRARKLVTDFRQRINRELHTELAEIPLFKMLDLKRALSGCKRGKTPGRDEIPMEFYLEGGSRLHTWFLLLTNKVMATQDIPHAWRHHEWIAVRKPGKNPSLPSSYRPITLMCTGAKLMEKL
eukprot:6491213-Amphidinium_carterae.1